jgi:chromosome segregation ATPase
MTTETEAERDRIEAEIATLDEQTTRIQAQLDHSDADGNPDRHWRADATAALRYKNRKRQELLIKLSRINKQMRIEHNAAMQRQFSDIAKRKLPPDVFASIVAEMTA